MGNLDLVFDKFDLQEGPEKHSYLQRHERVFQCSPFPIYSSAVVSVFERSSGCDQSSPFEFLISQGALLFQYWSLPFVVCKGGAKFFLNFLFSL